MLDALTYAGNRSTLEGAPAAELVVGDIRDQGLVETLLRERDVNTIVHFAAESHVDRSITGPDAFIDTNILGTNSLLKAARSVWLDGDGQAHRFHHISTDEVYGSLGPEDPKPLLIIWYEPIIIRMVSMSPPAIALTITGHTNILKSSSRFSASML